MADTADISRREAWVIAARPHVKPAGAAPVIVGTGLAVHQGVFAALPAIAALLGALLIQTGTDFANDYFDYAKGVDSDESAGYVRVSQSGLIPARRVFGAAVLCYGLAFLLGIYLVSIGGLPIVVVGLASIASGFAYSGGPYPIASHGLGDIFAFLFFGVIAVTGTYYVQASAVLLETIPVTVHPETLPLAAIVASLSMGGLITNILVVNNIRDIEDDRAAGKHTLAVHLGYRFSRVEYVLLTALAYAVPLWFFFRGAGVVVLLPVLSLPLAISATRQLYAGRDTETLNPALERTGKLVAAFGVLFGVGLAL
ncbi:1,4-dihydroxy-2-naphthoate octaprenyltransferase [Halodesulfurarchaeum formicicum]|uniref:1,4-dihydroxy-2-naphthoate octaprenyltransferase n=1 Tax=Halodesulfurarchaeum formicicum TaxID=1873524 RepID=A0A1D8S536_9EURY|nr:1,4-dihydroxy-2-naphthoate polyprenyltransferase [Halodesulfurarchaeum formicicum]AOW80470.1 1,4-dihydroxy-2-naphthoate octaprenyltransferase [Halodesulfurarchaeum formicicum]APE95809.1 1,4-dihydroxy-2-naphthoate octaprenyltransferase [Halodesulfurarchaeum formicicum]